MQRYTQDNVPQEILNRFPTLRNRPSSVHKTAQVCDSIKEDNHSNSNCNESKSCQNSSIALQDLQKKFPELSYVKDQRVLDRSSISSTVMTTQQPLLLLSTVRSLNKEFAPETLPYKEQVAINKAHCSLCPAHKKTQSGLFNDLPISHESPKKRYY